MRWCRRCAASRSWPCASFQTSSVTWQIAWIGSLAVREADAAGADAAGVDATRTDAGGTEDAAGVDPARTDGIIRALQGMAACMAAGALSGGNRRRRLRSQKGACVAGRDCPADLHGAPHFFRAAC